MKKIMGIAMVLLMLMSVTIAFADNAKDTQTDRKKVIIGFVDRPNQADENMIQGHGGKTKYTYSIIDAKAVELPEQAIEHIKKNPRVSYVEEDAEVHALVDELPWGINRIDADLVWNTEDGASDVMEGGNAGFGVKVAILDTGIDGSHPDLNVADGINFVVGSQFDSKYDDNWDDDNGHGTHCAGIVAALDNQEGVIGVAPKASLYAVKVLGRSGGGWTSDIIAGIEWSKENDIQVISMSIGGGYSESMETACKNAYEPEEPEYEGIVLVAAAGNEGGSVSYPAAYDSVIAVSATDENDLKAGFSNYGPEIELAAPGVGIYSTLPLDINRYHGYGYGMMSGTSMACPHVAGTAALVIASKPSVTNKEVRERLWETAEAIIDPDDLNGDFFGYGLVDAKAAVYPPPPTPQT